MMNECSALQIQAWDTLCTLADSPSITAVNKWIVCLTDFLIMKAMVYKWC